jgi:hypothetical protein
MVVRRAEEGSIVDIGWPATLMFDHVVRFRPLRRRRATRPHASAVAHGEGFALRGAEQPLRVAEVQHFAFAAEHDRPVAGITGELLHSACRHRFVDVIKPADPAP